MEKITIEATYTLIHNYLMQLDYFEGLSSMDEACKEDEWDVYHARRLFADELCCLGADVWAVGNAVTADCYHAIGEVAKAWAQEVFPEWSDYCDSLFNRHGDDSVCMTPAEPVGMTDAEEEAFWDAPFEF